MASTRGIEGSFYDPLSCRSLFQGSRLEVVCFLSTNGMPSFQGSVDSKNESSSSSFHIFTRPTYSIVSTVHGPKRVLGRVKTMYDGETKRKMVKNGGTGWRRQQKREQREVTAFVASEFST